MTIISAFKRINAFLLVMIMTSLIGAQEPNSGINQTSMAFRPGDGLYISTFPDTGSFLDRIFPIDGAGFVEFPVVGKVKVTDMSRDELTQFLKENFKSYLRSPNIYVKPVIRVSMLGGFARPGLYYVDPQASLWEVVRRAGGPVLAKGIYKMQWERDEDEQKDVTRFFEQGTSLKAMGFRSGDQLWTPSPEARTFWDAVADVMPIVTLGITITTLYMTYQRDQALLTRGRF
ncbi:MAG: hypothetical protein GF313_05230 [Caldithrix sp.]|nr:hypothetical protein [Caldithrix sp.]